MRAYWTLVKRELGGFFYSWTGYVVMASVLLLMGFSFWNLVLVLNNESTDQPVTQIIYSTFYFWIILLLGAPVITMRSFAQEKATGTLETLMTTPVRDCQVMLAKFSGALIFFMITWLPLIFCLLVVGHYTNEPDALDAGTLASTYLGIFLLGSLFLSIGCFASALTRSQIVAVMVSFAVGISLFLFSFLSMAFASQGGWQSRFFAQVGLIEHMKDFAAGVVDTRPLVFYLSLTFLFLYLTLKAIESRRWK